jgi:hypothetical protein
VSPGFAEKGFAIEGGFAVIRAIVDAIVRGAVHDKPQIARWVVAMPENPVPFRNLDRGCALVFVKFLTRNTRVLEQQSFEADENGLIATELSAEK